MPNEQLSFIQILVSCCYFRYELWLVNLLLVSLKNLPFFFMPERQVQRSFNRWRFKSERAGGRYLAKVIITVFVFDVTELKIALAPALNFHPHILNFTWIMGEGRSTTRVLPPPRHFLFLFFFFKTKFFKLCYSNFYTSNELIIDDKVQANF